MTTTTSTRTGQRGWLVPSLRATGCALRVPLLAVATTFALTWLAVAVALTAVGVGLWLVPPAARGVDRLVGAARYRVGLTPLRARPHRGPGVAARARETWDVVTDANVYRAVAWSVIDGVLGLFIAGVPATALVYGVFGVAVQPLLWSTIYEHGGSNWYTFVHVTSNTTAGYGAVVGGVLLLAGLVFARPVAAVSETFSRDLLGEP